ncbi:MerR family transcriptional regulator [Sphaerisporangium album]|uniref:MerR family transcriptional regulator n=1 Tax=Sphaerisporangium album TaxID=509200 RepID=A0A367FP61_9ACTN|nr:chaperone modulator CbpM [Sphaerisporangium album]RCG31612.1 MerR family transcriptional regulator [Sphaerisporangium album]
MATSLVRVPGIGLEAFARAGGLHPEQVRRLVRLGLLDPVAVSGNDIRFPPSQLVLLGRIERLHAGLALNYASLGVVIDLLDRIERLEDALRHRSRPTGVTSWTRTD